MGTGAGGKGDDTTEFQVVAPNSDVDWDSVEAGRQKGLLPVVMDTGASGREVVLVDPKSIEAGLQSARAGGDIQAWVKTLSGAERKWLLWQLEADLNPDLAKVRLATDMAELDVRKRPVEEIACQLSLPIFFGLLGRPMRPLPDGEKDPAPEECRAAAEERLERLIEHEREEPGERAYRHALVDLAMLLLNSPAPFPPALQMWVNGILAASREKPSGRASNRPRGGKDFSKRIARAIHMAVALGAKLPITRNDASEPNSICDAIVEILRESGLHMDYNAVKKAWTRNKGYPFPLFVWDIKSGL